MGHQYFYGPSYSARRPDIVFIDKNAKTVWVIDVAVPADRVP